MKQTVYLFLLLLVLVNCTGKTEERVVEVPMDTVSPISSQTSETVDTALAVSSNEKWTQDSTEDAVSVPHSESEEEEMQLSLPHDSITIDLKLNEITLQDFAKYESVYDKHMKAFKGDKDFLKMHGLYIGSDCHDICEAYLVEIESKKKMLLPSNYDAGIIGVPLSPAGNKMLVFSSYDGSDFSKYYGHRSEIFAYTIAQGSGLDAVKPLFTYYTRDFSIAKLTWIDENTIVLKVYKEDRSGDGSHLHYKYFKSRIK